MFCYYFIEYVIYPFGLHLFSFVNAHDSQGWFFDGVSEFLYIPFTALEFLIMTFFSNIYFILSSVILSSTCSTLLE
jgi:hypothetical protein